MAEIIPHKGCLFCTNYNGHLITPSTCTKLIATTLTKFIHFVVPSSISRSNDNYYYYYYDDEHEYDYESLFINSSYCKSCSDKSFEIVLIIEKLEKLQAELIKLQQGILEQLVNSLEDDEASLSLQQKDAKERILLELQASIAKSNSNIKKSDDDASSNSINSIPIPPATTTAVEYKDPSSAYVKLIQLNTKTLQNYNDNTTVQIKEEEEEESMEVEEAEEYLIDSILHQEEFELPPPPPEFEQDPLFDDYDDLNDDDAKVNIPDMLSKEQVQPTAAALRPCRSCPCRYPSCNYITTGPQSLRFHVTLRHIKNGDHKAENSQEFICTKCGYPSNSLQEQTAHFQQHHQIKSKYTSKYRTKTLPKTHFKRQRHEDLRRNRKSCFDVWSRLRPHTHNAKHLKTNNYLYTCKYCQSLQATSPPELWTHIKTTHGFVLKAEQNTSAAETPQAELKNFQCTLCAKYFDLNTSLQTHLMKNHTKDVSIITESSNPKRGPGGSQKKKRSHEQLAVTQTMLHCKFQGCIYIARAKPRLQSHVKEVHSIEPHSAAYIICPDCGLELPSSAKEQVAAHAQAHANESIPTSYPCAHCPKTFMYGASYQSHFRKAHPDFYVQSPAFLEATNTMSKALLSMTRFECSYCTEIAPNPKSLWKHLKKQHKTLFKTSDPSSGRKSCSFCPKSFRGHEAIHNHFMNVHTVQVIKNNTMLLKFTKHNKYDVLRCKFCALSEEAAEEDQEVKEFTQPNKLWLHIKSNHPHVLIEKQYEDCEFPTTATESEPGGEFQCTFCPKSYPIRPSIWGHLIRRHTGQVIVQQQQQPQHTYFEPEAEEIPTMQYNPESQSYICPYCQASFSKQDKLDGHIKRVHGDPVTCPLCSVSFKNKEAVKRHQAKAHRAELNLPIHQCETCGRVLGTVHALRIHIKVVHTRQGLLSCPEPGCTFQEAHQSKIRKHAQFVHRKEKNILCTVCGKAFYDNFKLKLHMMNHTGEKPFQCQICGKGFTSKIHLERHVPIHGTERPFSCDLCGLAFPTKNNLWGHQRSHHKGKGVGAGIRPSRKSKYNNLE